MCDIREEIDLAVDRREENMPKHVEQAKADALWSLRYGPSGGGCVYSFEAALEILRDWAETVEDVQIEVDYDEETEESVYESIDGSREEIIRRVLGRDLAAYI